MLDELTAYTRANTEFLEIIHEGAYTEDWRSPKYPVLVTSMRVLCINVPYLNYLGI